MLGTWTWLSKRIGEAYRVPATVGNEHAIARDDGVASPADGLMASIVWLLNMTVPTLPLACDIAMTFLMTLCTDPETGCRYSSGLGHSVPNSPTICRPVLYEGGAGDPSTSSADIGPRQCLAAQVIQRSVALRA